MGRNPISQTRERNGNPIFGSARLVVETSVLAVPLVIVLHDSGPKRKRWC